MPRFLGFLDDNGICNINGTCAANYALYELLFGKPRFEHICAVNHDLAVNHALWSFNAVNHRFGKHFRGKSHLKEPHACEARLRAAAVCHKTNEWIHLFVSVSKHTPVSTTCGVCKGERRRRRLLPIRQIYVGQQNLSDYRGLCICCILMRSLLETLLYAWKPIIYTTTPPSFKNMLTC